jgi:putative flippase GtrA
MAGLVGRIIEYVRGKSGGAETVRYIIAGALTTLVNFALFELLHSVLHISVTISNVTAISVSILFAYIVNKLMVFRRHSASLLSLVFEFFRFVGSRLFTMALEVGIVLLFHNVLNYNARLCKVAALVLVIIANYFLSRLLVFQSSDDSGS